MTIKHTIDHVREFHDAFGIENATEITPELTEQEYTLRYNLMREENEEYMDA
ncbi:MAG: hypothetical protein JKY42_08645, partial [Flavobacteriales bacterium]|nr:hypothetical protein [Flavobacteriales bacterium]